MNIRLASSPYQSSIPLAKVTELDPIGLSIEKRETLLLISHSARLTKQQIKLLKGHGTPCMLRILIGFQAGYAELFFTIEVTLYIS